MKTSAINLEGDMNVFIHFFGNPSNSSNISQTTNVNLMVELTGKVRAVVRMHCLRTLNVDVKIFQMISKNVDLLRVLQQNTR